MLIMKDGNKRVYNLLQYLGAVIRRRRIYKRLTVADLSKLTGVSVGVISDLENCRGRIPSLVNFIKIANALNFINAELNTIYHYEKLLTNLQ